MDTETLYQKFQEWIREGLITYDQFTSGPAKAFHAHGEAANNLLKETSLHVIGLDKGAWRSLLLTDEIIDLFGQARFQELKAAAQRAANDNERIRER